MNKQITQITLKISILAILMMVIIILATGCGDEKTNTTHKGKEANTKYTELNISFVGDIMAHDDQIAAAKDGDSYDFSDSFKYVKKYIGESDLAVCNLETTFAGSPYTGYPVFSAPEILADNVKDAGFDVAITANNHIFDKGLDALKRTGEITRDAGLDVVGTRETSHDKNYIIKKVKGVKIGIIAYTFESATVDGQRSLNNNPMDDETQSLLNSYNPAMLDEDLPEIKKSMADAREDGAEILMVYMHWGTEYATTPNAAEKDLAQEIADSGADMIFASHPHVIQEQGILKSSSDGTERNVPIFYSMGNFVSNQRLETVDNRLTEQGIIAQVKLSFDPKKKEIAGIDTGYIPTWVDKYEDANGLNYSIIPLIGNYEDNETLVKSGHSDRAKEAFNDVEAALGNPRN